MATAEEYLEIETYLSGPPSDDLVYCLCYEVDYEFDGEFREMVPPEHWDGLNGNR